MNWRVGFFRVWILLSAVWISAAIWVQNIPPIASGAPPFDETSPFLKVVPGVKMEALSDCETTAAQNAHVDLQNCVEYFQDARLQTMDRYMKKTTWVLMPPLAALFFGAAIGWVFRGFRHPEQRNRAL
jgi:hypothetical protein